MTKPLMIDLFAGLGGWAQGGIDEGYDVVGFDITRHAYGDMKYPAQLVLQDVTTLHGSQFRDAALIVASPPCQEYSYMAMPWTIAKAKAADIRADATGAKLAALNRLFDACFRIQREASAAAGQHIPMIVENVRGAQPWVGRSRWNFGSFHLWGDVPALMPMTKIIAKRPGHDWNRFKETGEVSPHWRLNGEDSLVVNPALKNTGGSWFGKQDQKQQRPRNDPRDGIKTAGHPNQRDGHRSTAHLTKPAEHIKQGGDWFAEKGSISRTTSSQSRKRKFASAMIAKIPLPLSRHIARTYYPR